MRALTYIALIAVVVWAGFAWEQASAPIVVTVEEEVMEPVESAPADTTTKVAEEQEEQEERELPPIQPGPLGATDLPEPPPEPPQVAYDEAYVEELELSIHGRINEERVAQGLNTLEYDETLAQVAAYHSTDMAENDYFAHEDDESCDSACRVTSAGYRWRMVGENLFLLRREDHFSAEGASAIVVAGWIGSKGHRENMFEPRFTEEGIGVVILGDTIYVTEVLTRPR